MLKIRNKILPRKIRRFSDSESGATAVEFALVAGPFFLLVFAIIESALFFFAGQFLESTVDDVARLFRTGQIDQNITVEKFREDHFCPRLVVLLDCDDVSTVVTTAASFNDLSNPPEPDPDTGELAEDNVVVPGPREIMQITAQVKWPVYTNYAAPLVNTAIGNFALISVTSVTRAEPFTVASGS